MTAGVPNLELNTGADIPQLGFGTYKIVGGDAKTPVAEAIAAGYRHIDTAALYQNEESVGQAIAESGIPREEFFITTKLWNTDQDRAEAAFEESLQRLGLDYVDLYLIHWPCPERNLYVSAWKALEKINESGKAKAIGVSNFLIEHLERLFAETSIVPAVNQIELHPAFQQKDITDFCHANDIQIEAWGPLGQGKYPLLETPAITDIAQQHQKTAGQVVLRWHIQRGNIVFPKSTSAERIVQNFDIFDFELSAEEVAVIDALESNKRLGHHPNEWN